MPGWCIHCRIPNIPSSREDTDIETVKGIGCDGFWLKGRKTGIDHFTPTIGDQGFDATLGKAAHQDAVSLQTALPGDLGFESGQLNAICGPPIIGPCIKTDRS